MASSPCQMGKLRPRGVSPGAEQRRGLEVWELTCSPPPRSLLQFQIWCFAPLCETVSFVRTIWEVVSATGGRTCPRSAKEREGAPVSLHMKGCLLALTWGKRLRSASALVLLCGSASSQTHALGVPACESFVEFELRTRF